MARFAIDLRALRDAAAPDWNVDQVAEAEQISRSAIYFALAGSRLPSIVVLKAMVTAWDPEAETTMKQWLYRRREIEGELSRIKSVAKRTAAVTATRDVAYDAPTSLPFARDVVVSADRQAEPPEPSPIVVSSQLRNIYDAAGRPSVRSIFREIEKRHPDRPVGISTVHRVLTENYFTPSVATVIRVLAEMSGRDPDAEVEAVAQVYEARSSTTGAVRSRRSGRPRQPVDPGLDPELRRFVELLQAIADSTNLTLREISAVLHYDVSTVSRFLSGKRVPPRDFLVRLVAVAEERAGQPFAADVRKHLMALWMEAMRVSRPTEHRIAVLEAQLAEAERRLADRER